ncbi:alpha/beta fold hydrolase [Alphaproteobacteria bacterium KMM 3653]|uniref:Alpha/beta fold hydrolase n=1 Tax=Harenicola maris TaxID=2841044 RepID=A0AAP2CS73_9RHOB|nr:alpha/beta fold hydrolase [Harenicola maris]
MADLDGIDWDEAFKNGDYIPDGETFPDLWAQQAERFRVSAKGRLGLPYGALPEERFDLFLPEGPPKGLALFVHGGYWLAFDRSFWSHLAAGPLGHGWAVAMPGYTLAPKARIRSITRQIGRAIAAAADHVAGPICLTGHSAGGHLVSRMLCDDAPLSAPLRSRIERVVSLSGLHDLRPLLHTEMNQTLRLDVEEARAESSALHPPASQAEIIAWVGGGERPEFLRQSALLVENWGRQGANTRLVVEAERHHFDVIAGLTDPDAPLTRALVGARG